MTDKEITELEAGWDLGLPEPDFDHVTATVSVALKHEYEAECGQGGTQRKGAKAQRRRRYVLAAFVALLVGGLGTAGYAALTGTSTASDGIGCYSGEDLGGSTTIVGLDGRRATKTCAELWAAGDVVAGASRAPAPLHACVAGDGGGGIHVFASNDSSICDRLNLAEDPDAGADPYSRRFGEFSSQLSATLERNELEASGCTGRGQMRGLVDRLLAKYGLRDWTIVESDEFDQVHLCATLALDSDARTVTLFAESP